MLKVDRELDECWLNLTEEEKEQIHNPLIERTLEQINDPLAFYFNIMRKPENFHLFTKWFLNVELFPFQIAILKELWNRQFPLFLATRGGGKTFLLAMYALLHAFFKQGSKIVMVGASFRQSKLIFDYVETFWNKGKLLQACLQGLPNQGPSKQTDQYQMRIGDSTITAVPLGMGDKIRGLRATVTMCDEFDSIPIEIYEVVLQGFGSVSASPLEKAKKAARFERLKERGRWSPALQKNFDESMGGNKQILSGTAGYKFNHFYAYYERYRTIIESKGSPEKLRNVFGDDGPPDKFNYKDFSIIRLPYNVLPPHYMDEKTIARAKSTLTQGHFHKEYSCIFSDDSQGFFTRRLIESCVVNDNVTTVDGTVVEPFEAVLYGAKGHSYVFGIDPAIEKDYFTIVVLELHKDHKRIVHAWSSKKSEHTKLLHQGLTKDSDFFVFCTKKIRELMKVFPCIHIALDSQGGGFAIREALGDSNNVPEGELPVYPIRDPDDPQYTDRLTGLHILEMVSFSSQEWTLQANEGLKKDFEDKTTLFPYFDPVTILEAAQYDSTNGLKHDSLETCVYEIEELKNELSTIVHSRTSLMGRDRWDTPEIKEAGGKKGRQHKDRYSALLMANMAARKMQREPEKPKNSLIGGAAHELKHSKLNNDRLYNQDHYDQLMKSIFQGYDV